MNRPVRSTLVFGAVSALAVMPVTWLFSGPVGWSMAFKLALWVDLMAYAVLLARWSGKTPVAVLFPMTLLLGVALWPGADHGFFYLGLGVFSWVRSGICFTGRPLRAVAAEIITGTGAAGLVALLNPGSTISWAVSIWLFTLIQALYFFIVPPADGPATVDASRDHFEQARREAQRVLDEIG